MSASQRDEPVPANVTGPAERDAFELAHRRICGWQADVLLARRPDGRYCSARAEEGWQHWLAARGLA